ncbi:MAG: argininosuccinate lyase [Cardiobacteriaceae bacterium]|nr:argininosuccinate lyase [Cardiobacteriaceae bacterium]
MDYAQFPDPVYRDTVLKPLFDGAKHYHADAFRAIDRAHLVMLAESGILDAEIAKKLAEALAAIDEEIDPQTLEYTGEVEDYFFAREKALKARLGVDTGGRLHTARSRNDIDHTVFKLALKARIDALLADLRALLAALIAKAEAEKATLVMAYTHGQPAQPTTFGHYLAALIEILLRDMARLESARETVNLCSMGAAAITTSGFAIDRARVAELLGFAAPQENSYGCIAAVDYVTATYSAIELVFLHLGRFIQDLQFHTAFEVGQIHVPDAFVQISSIMPQKRNPVPIEHLRHLASQTVARARMMRDIVHNTPFTDMNDSEGETQETGYQTFASAHRVLRLLASLVPALQINEKRVRGHMDNACVTITELADELVRREDLSFRAAHEIAAVVAKAVVAREESLSQGGFAPFRQAFQEVVGRETAIDADTFAHIVSPEHFVAVRERFGGPGKKALGEALCRYRTELDLRARRAEVIRKKEDNAALALAQAFHQLTETR